MADRVAALKAEIAYVEAQEKFIAAKLAAKAAPSDAKLQVAWDKAQAEFVPLVDNYRATRQAPNGPGDGTANPDTFKAGAKPQAVGG